MRVTNVSMPTGQLVEITYTNHRGETAVRRVIPTKLWHGQLTGHPCAAAYPEPQWFIDCWDVDKNDVRSFALANITP